jgi:site-specific DNA-methyltransferase (adenine-specific)
VKLRYQSNLTRFYEGECISWLKTQPDHSFHAVVTDPPYGLVEFSEPHLEKRDAGSGGIWRIPPSFDGAERAPLPRFTALSDQQTSDLGKFFRRWARALLPKLVPGAHVFIASTPILSHLLSHALAQGGLERRGEVIRLVQTFRGGDRPKGAEREFPEVSTLPRGAWEPWLLFRRPLDATVAETLRKFGTGGLRRPSVSVPFNDLVPSGRTPRREKALADHPSLKPQAFLRQIVRAALPLGTGLVLDPFAGSGSTLAAAEAIGYRSVGVEMNPTYAGRAVAAIPALAALELPAAGLTVPKPHGPALESEVEARPSADRVA